MSSEINRGHEFSLDELLYELSHRKMVLGQQSYAWFTHSHVTGVLNTLEPLSNESPLSKESAA